MIHCISAMCWNLGGQEIKEGEERWGAMKILTREFCWPRVSDNSSCKKTAKVVGFGLEYPDIAQIKFRDLGIAPPQETKRPKDEDAVPCRKSFVTFVHVTCPLWSLKLEFEFFETFDVWESFEVSVHVMRYYWPFMILVTVWILWTSEAAQDVKKKKKDLKESRSQASFFF